MKFANYLSFQMRLKFIFLFFATLLKSILKLLQCTASNEYFSILHKNESTIFKCKTFIYLFANTLERELSRVPSSELRWSEPYPGVGQDEPRMLRSLLGAARRYSFFSLSSLTLLSIYLLGNLLFVRLILLFPSLLSYLLLLFLSSCMQCAPLSSPSFSAPFLPSPSHHPLELGLVVPSGNGCPTYMQACASCARICVGLYCVRWKARRGNRWMRAYVSRIIRVYV